MGRISSQGDNLIMWIAKGFHKYAGIIFIYNHSSESNRDATYEKMKERVEILNNSIIFSCVLHKL